MLFLRSSPPTAKPGMPGIPSVDKVTKNSADLSWAKPRHDGGRMKGEATNAPTMVQP